MYIDLPEIIPRMHSTSMFFSGMCLAQIKAYMNACKDTLAFMALLSYEMVSPMPVCAYSYNSPISNCPLPFRFLMTLFS